MNIYKSDKCILTVNNKEIHYYIIQGGKLLEFPSEVINEEDIKHILHRFTLLDDIEALKTLLLFNQLIGGQS